MQPWAWADIAAAAAAVFIIAVALHRVVRSIISWRRARAAAALPDGQKRLLRGIKTKGSGVRTSPWSPQAAMHPYHCTSPASLAVPTAAGLQCLHSTSRQHACACLRRLLLTHAERLTHSTLPC